MTVKCKAEKIKVEIANKNIKDYQKEDVADFVVFHDYDGGEDVGKIGRCGDK